MISPPNGSGSYWLDSIFDNLYQEVRHPAILDALKALHQKGATLLTTSYDDVLGRHCGLRRIDRSNHNDVLRFKRGDIDGVFLTYGSYRDIHEVVLNTADYNYERHWNEVKSILKNALEFKTILFVGCGYWDKDSSFDGLLEWVSEHRESISNRHCLLVPYGDTPDCEPLVRIEHIMYGLDYGDLELFLGQLSETSIGVPELPGLSVLRRAERGLI